MIDLGATWVIARLTLREAMRRRMLLALFGLSGVAVLLTAWGYGQLQNVPGVSTGNVSIDQVQLVASQATNFARAICGRSGKRLTLMCGKFVRTTGHPAGTSRVVRD